ncbi:MAG TPA: 2-aminoethylphosphonate aminotransferase [Steroidobacteraceae bacterium]|nr:2-aminoethylphosphonate aminotransferase [Steroidobacteraceae bacterium]
MLLLNPGPVTLSERVRRSLLQPDLCHRESEFFDLQDDLRAHLLGVYGLDPAVWTAVLMTGSGTAAVESMVASLVPEGGRLLVVENGVYGDRIAQMCAQYRIPHERVVGSWMEAPSPASIAAKLDSGTGPFTHLAVVHHETTTGRLNELKPLAELCRTRNLQLLVDGVSSFGAESLDFAGPLAAVAATANKCLHGVPGVSFVIASRASVARAASRTYYLDLGRLARLQDQRNTPFTPAVHACYGLLEALREFDEEGGWTARHARYSALAEQVRAGLAALGIETVLPPAESSVVLRSYRLPAGLTYDRLHDELKAGGFVIYAGQGDLSKTLFRISTMGQLTRTDIDRLLTCFAKLR